MKPSLEQVVSKPAPRVLSDAEIEQVGGGLIFLPWMGYVAWTLVGAGVGLGAAYVAAHIR